VSRFLPTSRRLVQFSEGQSAPEGSTIVYIDGAFDVFHAGHVEILRVRGEGGRERGGGGGGGGGEGGGSDREWIRTGGPQVSPKGTSSSSYGASCFTHRYNQ